MIDRRSHDEDGFAMITAVILIMIMALLGAVILDNGAHADRQSGHGRNWNAALDVAESGVEQAVATLQANNGATPAPFSGASGSGNYSTTVTYLGRHRYQIDSTGTVGTTGGLEAQRKLRVVYAPPPSFLFALFSLTDINTKNNDYVKGDVWANGSVTVDQNDTVDGSATAATGTVYLDNGSHVTGDVWSGGSDASGEAVDISTNAVVGGKVKASSTSPDCSDDPGHSGYKVNVVGTVTGTVTTWGVKTGAGSTGIVTTGVCTNAAPTKTIPTFTWNPANYPSVQTFASPTAFNNWLAIGSNKSNLSGTFYVNGGGSSDYIELNGVTIGGDTTIVAPQAPIDANGGSGLADANNADKLLVLVSYYQPPAGSVCTDNGGNPKDCAIGIKNNFQPSKNTATLLFAPNGPIAFKNNAEFVGAVYGNDIVLKNNQETYYDGRVDQIVGFGPVTLQQESWTETTS
jgi:hypothetical protein